jgi:hypothetical protein
MTSYFIAYFYQKIGSNWGLGCTTVKRESPVLNWDDIQDIQKTIESRDSELESVVILNWRRFENPE